MEVSSEPVSSKHDNERVLALAGQNGTCGYWSGGQIMRAVFDVNVHS